MLRIDDLRADYDGVPVLSGVSLRVEAGEIVALVGANASGKTTLLSCVSRVVTRFTGSVFFEGRRIDAMRPEQVAGAGLVQVPEGRLLFPELTVEENLKLGAYAARSRAGRARRLRDIYAVFPRLEERARQRAGSLSGGEAQMCAIGRGLMANPKLILFDEPSLGLAPLVVREVTDAIGRIRESGVTVLLSEQNARRALGIADRAYVMAGGRVVLEGKGRALLDDPTVRRVYLGV